MYNLLWEGWRHGVRYHGWWGWWLLGLLRWLGCKWELGVAHAILGGHLSASERRSLEALAAKSTHLSGDAEASLSVATVAVAIATARAAAVTPVAAILGFGAKGTFLSSTKPPIAIPVTTTEIPPPPRIPIPSVVLVATSSPSSTTSSVVRHLDQLGVDGLVGLAEHRDQVAGLFHVVGGEEGVGRARFLTAGRASNAVDIVLGGVRVVIIDDKFHILHI